LGAGGRPNHFFSGSPPNDISSDWNGGGGDGSDLLRVKRIWGGGGSGQGINVVTLSFGELSLYGGRGGNGGRQTTGINGEAPGGGGGGNNNNLNGGNGGAGRVIVTVW
jgi:hypothetical protein